MLCLPHNFAVKYWPWVRRGPLNGFDGLHLPLIDDCQWKTKEQPRSLVALQMPFHISALDRKLPSGVCLPCQQGGDACCFHWPVFLGQIIGYHWRFHRKNLSCYFLTLGRTREKKTEVNVSRAASPGSQAGHQHILDCSGYLRTSHLCPSAHFTFRLQA